MTDSELEEQSTTEDEGETAEREAASTEGAAEAPPPAAAEPEEPGILAMLREYYLTFDRRTLGFSRIMLGFLLVMDLFHRGRSWAEMYSTDGVLPNNLNLFRPQAWGAFTIFNAFSSPGELRVLWCVGMAIALCLLVGYKTKAAQIAALIFVTGMNGRVLLIENGGYVVNNLLFLWTCFLPLGDRFSVDALLGSMKRRREASADELNDRTDVLTPEQEKPFVSLLGFVLIIQLSAIYFFNVIHKTGPAWKNGTAVHYVLYVDRMATPIVGLLRDYLPNWAIIFMTKATLGFEAGLPVALLSPLGRVWSKRAAIFGINALHLAFGITFVLGPFAWSLCVFSTLLFSREDWELAFRTMRREHRARAVLFDPRSAAAVLVCRVLKRLDHFELLVFREAQGIPLGVALEGEGGALITGSTLVADVLDALPLGPILGSFIRLPGVSGLVDAVSARLEKRNLSADLGIAAQPSYTAPEPSSVRRAGRTALSVVRELCILAMFAGAVNQALVELWVVNRLIKVPQPEPLAVLSHKMRFLQGWFMFSPNPVMDDGTIVVDAITVDGRHVDPFSIHVEPYTLRAPDFDLIHAKSLRLNQIWCDYFNRIHLPGNTGYRDAMKEYMLKLPQRTGHPEDALVSGDVYWIQDLNPQWNQKESTKFEKNKLFSFDNPAAQKAPAQVPISAN